MTIILGIICIFEGIQRPRTSLRPISSWRCRDDEFVVVDVFIPSESEGIVRDFHGGYVSSQPSHHPWGITRSTSSPALEKPPPSQAPHYLGYPLSLIPVELDGVFPSFCSSAWPSISLSNTYHNSETLACLWFLDWTAQQIRLWCALALVCGSLSSPLHILVNCPRRGFGSDKCNRRPSLIES